MKAILKNYRQSPRKVRLVADLMRGKSVSQAKAALSFLPKKATPALEKLLDSAVANAQNAGVSSGDLFIKKITVDKGLVMRRYRPFARGRAGSISKIMSTIRIELDTKQKTENRKQRTGVRKTKTAKKTTTSA